jgi:hypothetical protein
MRKSRVAMAPAKHVFLVRILDRDNKPTHMQIVKTVEDGKALYEEMANHDEFLEDEVEFEISQGAIILASIPLEKVEVV